MKPRIKTIVVTGPTATGKTALGVSLARRFDGEVISVDSRQVFRGMDIGTGKDLSDFGEGEEFVPYHLIDVVDPNDDYNLVRYCNDVKKSFDAIASKKKLPFFIGGTALYLDAVLKGYTMSGGPPDSNLRKELKRKTASEIATMLKEQHPEAYEAIKDKGNKNRLLRGFEKSKNLSNATPPLAEQLAPLILGVYYHRKDVHKRIEERLDARIDEGMIEEVQKLHENGVSWERLDYFGLEYRYVSMFLKGEIGRDEMRDKLLVKIRQFAKRQDIWFRKMEREGTEIHWIEQGDFAQASELVSKFLDGTKIPPPKIRLNDIRYGPKSS